MVEGNWNTGKKNLTVFLSFILKYNLFICLTITNEAKITIFLKLELYGIIHLKM